MTFSQHIKVLSTLVVTSIMCFCLSIFLPITKIPIVLTSLIVGHLVINVIPGLSLHTQYWIVNRKAQLIFDLENRTIAYCSDKIHLSKKYDQIAELTYYATVGHISRKGRFETTGFDAYRFYKVKFDDGQTIYITCLMMNDIEHSLETLVKTEADWRYRVFPFIY